MSAVSAEEFAQLILAFSVLDRKKIRRGDLIKLLVSGIGCCYVNSLIRCWIGWRVGYCVDSLIRQMNRRLVCELDDRLVGWSIDWLISTEH